MKKYIKIALIIIMIVLVGVGSYFVSKIITENYLKENKTVENINLKKFVTEFNKNLKDYKIDTELSLDEGVGIYAKVKKV